MWSTVCHYYSVIYCIDIKDLDIIIKELTSINHLDCTDWHCLGLYLGLFEPTLKAIGKDHKECKDCLIECMSAWLKGEDKVREVGGGPCWLSLVSALDTIGEKHIATNIRDKYCIK